MNKCHNYDYRNSIHTYNFIARELRRFFQDKKGFVEVPSNSRVSILAACEDPKTVTTYTLGNTLWPLPQTGQMWLEFELLKNPDLNGVFCLGPSYRNEPNPIEGRHYRIFPLFEFEAKGDINDLRALETELLLFLGLEAPISLDYEEMCKQYQVDFVETKEETMMWHEFGNAITLEKFPHRSHPFFNMKHDKDGVYNKIDVILHGAETIGSAERSCDVEEMRRDFRTISNGEYSQLLFEKFGKERVLEELEEYFSLNFFSRFGGGIGMTRLERAMKMAGLLDNVGTTFHIPHTYKQQQPTL